MFPFNILLAQPPPRPPVPDPANVFALQIHDGQLPLANYLRLHPALKLSLEAWANRKQKQIERQRQQIREQEPGIQPANTQLLEWLRTRQI